MDSSQLGEGASLASMPHVLVRKWFDYDQDVTGCFDKVNNFTYMISVFGFSFLFSICNYFFNSS